MMKPLQVGKHFYIHDNNLVQTGFKFYNLFKEYQALVYK